MNHIKRLFLSLTVLMAAAALLQQFTGWQPFGIASVLTAPALVYISLRYSRRLEA
jgi:hypothetical protein